MTGVRFLEGVAYAAVVWPAGWFIGGKIGAWVCDRVTAWIERVDQ